MTAPRPLPTPPASPPAAEPPANGLPPVARLSELLASPTDRRRFLTRAAALGVTLPSAGALLGCETREHDGTAARSRGTAGTAGAAGTAGGQDQGHEAHQPGGRSNDDAAPAGVRPPDYKVYDAALPPVAPGSRVRIEMVARELPVHLTRDLVVPAWTFDGTIPGPVVHVRVGQTVEFTLRNEGQVPHSMDFHAAQIDPKQAFAPVLPGKSISYTFTPRYPGAFLYHCGTQPVLMHIGSGMYGAIIVDPVRPLPKAREFVLVQSEFYIGKDESGAPRMDYQKMLDELPDHVAFNGIPNQYQDAPLVVRKGERVRFYVVNAGPSHPCSFHVVGEQFDTVYLGAPPGNPIHGVQTFMVAPGGGMIFELECDVAGDFPFVNHGFGHGQKGAIGVLRVQ
ncbi:MAG TPA: multicopper oxidase domain-containing protein [Gemmatimonadales bacterium]|nr:multicopper oxidase domain-containing protein [Gemmatimonadales bacterium]